MAITIEQQPEFLNGIGIFTDEENANIFRFSSPSQHLVENFKFRVIVQLNGSGLVLHDAYIQYGYLNLYPILKQYNILPAVDYSNTGGLVLFNRDWIKVTIQSTTQSGGGSRTEFENFTTPITGGGMLYINKGNLNGRELPFPPFTHDVVTKINFAKSPKGRFQMLNLFANATSRVVKKTYNPTAVSLVSQPTTDVKVGGMADDLITLPPTASRVEYYIGTASTNVGGFTYTLENDACVENNIVTWRNNFGFLTAFNFGHSALHEGAIESRNYATQISKRAITRTTEYVDVTTTFIKEAEHRMLTGILQSPEVYLNGVPVIPITSAYKLLDKRFDSLINMTIRLEYAQKQNSILL